MFRGKQLGPDRKRSAAGFIFYTEEGTECSGLAFSGRTDAGKEGANSILTMDAYEQDQIVSFMYSQTEDRRSYGLVLNERPFTPLSDLVEQIMGWRRFLFMAKFLLSPGFRRKMKVEHGPRLRLFRQGSGEVGMYMHDTKCRERIRIVVDADDNPKMEFLDERGKITYKLPPD